MEGPPILAAGFARSVDGYRAAWIKAHSKAEQGMFDALLWFFRQNADDVAAEVAQSPTEAAFRPPEFLNGLQDVLTAALTDTAMIGVERELGHVNAVLESAGSDRPALAFGTLHED